MLYPPIGCFLNRGILFVVFNNFQHLFWGNNERFYWKIFLFPVIKYAAVDVYYCIVFHFFFFLSSLAKEISSFISSKDIFELPFCLDISCIFFIVSRA